MAAWWKEQAVYQIYPMSYCDSNGDGMGDIPGIISKLPYIKSLGVGILWLSPVYRSPGEDNGYDISDYCDIDPKFGTLSDMDELIQKANALGLKIVMDLVVNHTSDQHSWFQKSRRREAPYEDFYIWRNGRGKRPPNNWTSFFGGGAWAYDEVRKQWYLHLFAKGQPDLNYRNPAVIEAVEQVMDFWLSRGVSGFRCDVINLLWKDSLNNGFPKGALVGSEYYISRPGCHELLQRFRREVLSKYDCFTVGETVFVSPQKAHALTDPDRGELDMVFSFEHMNADCFFVKWFPRKFKAQRMFKSLVKWQKKLPWNAVYFENHDQPRSVSRFGDGSPAAAKAILTLLLTLRGTPFVYQGEELGMTNFDFTSMADIQDVESKNMVPTLKKLGLNEEKVFKRMRHASRDNARTPMQWTPGYQAGFTTGTPWLKVNGNHVTINAETEESDPDSVLAWFRTLMAYRNGSDVLKQGSFRLISREKSWIKIQRRLGDDRVTVAVNWSDKPAKLPLVGRPVLSTHGTREVDCELKPWEAVILEEPASKMLSMLFKDSKQRQNTPLAISRAKELYFMNFANYGNMKRNGEYEEYMQYHISEALEQEWGRMIIDDLAGKIRDGKEVWRVANLANIRMDESEIVKCFQGLSKAPNADDIYAATKKVGSLIAPDLLEKILSAMVDGAQNCNIEGVQQP